MTAWQVYWVMQLDGIGYTLTFFTFALVCAALQFLFIGSLITERGSSYATDKQDAARATIQRRTKWLVIGAIATATVNVFVPTTKTAAAMVVLPAIANSEAIRAEAGDLYHIAKQALREAVTDDQPEPQK